MAVGLAGAAVGVGAYLAVVYAYDKMMNLIYGDPEEEALDEMGRRRQQNLAGAALAEQKRGLREEFQDQDAAAFEAPINEGVALAKARMYGGVGGGERPMLEHLSQKLGVDPDELRARLSHQGQTRSIPMPSLGAAALGGMNYE